MTIVGADEIYKKISSQIDSQFPGFIREEGPNFVAFLKAYYEYMEQSGNVVEATRRIPDIQDIDRTVDEDRKSTRLNSSHSQQSRMPSSA